MATTSASESNFANPYIPRSLCQIVGLACLAGFVVDMLVLAVPPNPFGLEWRVSIMQQMSDRSIILLLGIALTLFGSLENRAFRKQLALAALLIGVFFSLCSVLVIRDGIVLQQQTIASIGNQAVQIQTQLQQAQTNPPPDLDATPEQIQQAAQRVKAETETLKQNTKITSMKSTFASVGNLLAVGIGLISLGRASARSYR